MAPAAGYFIYLRKKDPKFMHLHVQMHLFFHGMLQQVPAVEIAWILSFGG